MPAAGGQNRPFVEIKDGTWRRFAACAKVDPAYADFFYEGTTSAAVENLRRCRAICDGCPAKAPCLEYAVQTAEPFGIWAGTTREQRRAIRKARGLARTRRESA